MLKLDSDLSLLVFIVQKLILVVEKRFNKSNLLPEIHPVSFRLKRLLLTKVKYSVKLNLNMKILCSNLL